MTGSVYALADPRQPAAIRYVGQTRVCPQRRLTQHMSVAHHSRVWSGRWMASLRRDGVRPRLVVLASVDVERLSAVEMAWIAHFRGTGHRLTNITDGGEGHTGKKRPEHVAKIAAWHRGKKRSVDTRRRISEAKKGRVMTPRSPDVRARLSLRWTDEMKAQKAAVLRALWQEPEYRARLMEKRSTQTPPARKLSIDAVRDIRRQHGEGATIRGLARVFMVTPPAIRAVVRGVTFKETKVAS